MRILENLGLSFDDVAMIPQYSCVESRSDVDLTMKLYTSDPEVVYSFDLPVISSPMSTVTEDEMAFRMYINGGLGIIHRFNTIEEQVALVESAHKKYEKFYYDIGAPLQNFSNSDFICGAAIGATGDYIERCQALIQAGVKIICVDIAHGNHLIMKEALTELKKIIPKHIHIMASSVADANGFMNFEIWGAHSARIGISSGGNCSTFLATGHGLPTFQSLIDCRKFRFNPKFGLIADGGMRYPGDICVTGDTKILTKNLEWIEAKNLLPGEELIAFDEYPEYGKFKHKNRKFKTTKIIDNNSQKLKCFKIETDKGSVSCSTEHLWLCTPNRGHGFVWKKTKDLLINDQIIFFGKPWEAINSREAGYLCGFLDGEGFCVKSGNSRFVGFSQVVGKTANYASSLLKMFSPNAKMYERKSVNLQHQDQLTFHIYGTYEMLKLLGEIRPERLLDKAQKLWDDVALTNMDKATIMNIIDIGEQETYTVNTESRTYIANGFMSHNCKSFGAGATMCILGSMLAGTKAAPGHIIKTDDGRWTKEHRGSASEANQKLRGIKNPKVEGVSALVPYKGKVENVLQSIKDGLQSGCSYSGVWRLEELYAKAIFQQITQSGYIQGTPHILTRK